MAQLNTILSYYYVGMWAIQGDSKDDLDFSGAWPLLEAMAYVDNPGETACGAVLPGEGGCSDHLPNVGFMAYAPNDPFQTPDLTPDGYILPPWYSNPLIPQPGVLPTDAMVNFASLPIFASLPEMLASGLPRVRVNFSGTGELEIEFVGVIQGGYVLCVIDGNPLDNRIYDLNAYSVTDASIIEDIFDVVIGQALNSTVTAEFQFDTAGDHFVDVTFLPQISADTILGFGGGIRRISLCDGLEMGETVMPQMRTIDSGCTLQWRPNSAAAWVTLSTDLCGADGTPGADGASVEMRVSAGYIQWRQSDGSPDWTNLVSIESLTGAPGAPGAPGGTGATGATGADGASVELRIFGGYIQWRQDDNNPTWANLIALADLEGEPGAPGTPGADGAAMAHYSDYYPPQVRLSVALYVTRWLWQNVRRPLGQATASGETSAAFWAGFAGSDYDNARMVWAATVGAASNADLLAAISGLDHPDTFPEWVCNMYSALPVNLVIAPSFVGEIRSFWEGVVSGNVPALTEAQIDLAVGGTSITYQSLQEKITTALQVNEPTVGYDGCLPDLNNSWGRYFNVNGGSWSTEFQFTNALWVSGSGYRQNSKPARARIARPLVIIDRACAEFFVSSGDTMQAWWIDIATGRVLAEYDHTEPTPGGDTPSFTWIAEPGFYCEQGIALEFAHNDGGDSSLAYLVRISLGGVDADIGAGGVGFGCE